MYGITKVKVGEEFLCGEYFTRPAPYDGCSDNKIELYRFDKLHVVSIHDHIAHVHVTSISDTTVSEDFRCKVEDLIACLNTGIAFVRYEDYLKMDDKLNRKRR